MKIIPQRIYDTQAESGYRVLVDRLWPRGISKEKARLDDTWKDIAPSDDLRRRFHGGKIDWAEFQKHYLHELVGNKALAKAHLDGVKGDTLLLLYGAKDTEHNHARILKAYLEKLR